MNVPDNFIENNFKLFIQFCKNNDLYQTLLTKNRNKVLSPNYARDVEELLQKEKRFFQIFNQGHTIECVNHIKVPILDIDYKCQQDEYIYFSLIRMLNIIFVGDSREDNGNYYQKWHMKLFDFICVLKPNLKKYYESYSS